MGQIQFNKNILLENWDHNDYGCYRCYANTPSIIGVIIIRKTLTYNVSYSWHLLKYNNMFKNCYGNKFSVQLYSLNNIKDLVDNFLIKFNKMKVFI